MSRPPLPLKRFTCPQCSRDFYYRRCYVRVYCSEACQWAAKVKGWWRNCGHCARAIWQVPHRPRPYCNQACYFAFRKKAKQERKEILCVARKLTEVFRACTSRAS
jgi:hypothetical protein